MRRSCLRLWAQGNYVNRRLFIFCSAVSGILCIATVGLWARSLWRYERFGYNSGFQTHDLRSLDGTLCVSVFTVDPDPFGEHTRELSWDSVRVSAGWPRWAALGFRSVSFRRSSYSIGGIGDTPQYHHYIMYLGIPYWILFTITALLPLRHLYIVRTRWQREKRQKRGLCETCGYNLTGNVSGVCPECGDSIGCTGSGEDMAIRNGVRR